MKIFRKKNAIGISVIGAVIGVPFHCAPSSSSMGEEDLRIRVNYANRPVFSNSISSPNFVPALYKPDFMVE